MVSLRRAKVLSEFTCVHSGAPRGLRVHSGSHWFTGACLGVVGFIRIRVGSLVRTYAMSGSLGFAWFQSSALVVVGFIHVRVGSHGYA